MNLLALIKTLPTWMPPASGTSRNTGDDSRVLHRRLQQGGLRPPSGPALQRRAGGAVRPGAGDPGVLLSGQSGGRAGYHHYRQQSEGDLSPSRTGPGPAHHHFGRSARVRAPSAFLELGYHDNPEDAAWIKSSLDAVAKNLVISLTDYFDIPFLLPQPSRSGQVDVDWGVLNIRARPELDAPILVQAPDGAPLTVRNSTRTGIWWTTTEQWVTPGGFSSH